MNIAPPLGLLLPLLLLWWGCSGGPVDPQRECEVSSDCPTDHTCTAAGQCAPLTVFSCTRDGDCALGQRCGPSLRCVSTTSSGDAGFWPSDGGEPRPQEDAGPTARLDLGGLRGTAPEVVGVEPPSGTHELPLETSFALRFSEPMRPLTVNVSAIYLVDTAGSKVEARLDYHEADARAVLTPVSPLAPGTTYRLRVEPYPRDMDDNLPLRSGTEYAYFTGGVEVPQEHQQLALRWAPALYQGIADEGRWRDDWPVALDFDGDLDAANNASSAARPGLAPGATVYYNVARTETHDFLHYLLYYPRRVSGDPSQAAEHDFAALLLVIDRATGALVAAEGPQLGASSEVFVRYRPTSGALELRGRDHPLLVYDPASLDSPEDRYPFYVPGGVHESCNFARKGSTAPPLCLHEAGAFRSGHTGALLVPDAAAGSSFAEATLDADGLRRGTYHLVSFLREIWPLRGAYGEGLLFDAASAYRPEGTMRPGAQSSLFVPKNLRSRASASFGRMPFMWFNFVGHDNHGQWFLDPAYMMWAHWVVGDESTFSQAYCYNALLGIDRRGAADAPRCP